MFSGTSSPAYKPLTNQGCSLISPMVYLLRGLGFKIDFTSGDETLNKDDPNWYIGTYWGDCIAFKQSI